MTPYDLQNYNYVMSLSDKDYDKFLDECSDDVLAYLQELIDQKKAELTLAIIEARDKEADKDTTEAEQLLKKYML